MPVRLKSRQQSPPNGFLYEQRETGWRNWLVEPHTVWDFNGLVQAVARHRNANRARFPGFNLDVNAIADEIDMVNAARVSRIAGAESYLMEAGNGGLPIPKTMPPSPLPRVVGASSMFSPHVLVEWLGEGAKVVAPEEATRRAAICAKCPQNYPGNWTRFFTVHTASVIQSQIEARHGMKLETPFDDQISICKACSCVLKLKVHVEPEVIKTRLSAETKAGLDPSCWIRSL